MLVAVTRCGWRLWRRPLALRHAGMAVRVQTLKASR